MCLEYTETKMILDDFMHFSESVYQHKSFLKTGHSIIN